MWMTLSTTCKLIVAKGSNSDKLAACSDGPVRVFSSCPMLPAIPGSRSRRSSVLQIAETCEVALLLAILVTCRLSSDERRFSKFAARSDAPVVAFPRCSAVPTVLGSCCKPSPLLSFAEICETASLSATFGTCQLLADSETRFSLVAATV